MKSAVHSESSQTYRPEVICFDLGGVLVQIRHRWDEVIRAAGFEPDEKYAVSLYEAPALFQYQDGLIDDAEYSHQLGAWLGQPSTEALEVHLAILDRDYPGALELVQGLQRSGFFTCCFSNTNRSHWERLCSVEFHPAVASLNARFASHELGLAKPTQESFAAVEAQLPPHDRVVFFDDTPPNVEAALKFGWTAFPIDPFDDPVRQMRERLRTLGLLDAF